MVAVEDGLEKRPGVKVVRCFGNIVYLGIYSTLVNQNHTLKYGT